MALGFFLGQQSLWLLEAARHLHRPYHLINLHTDRISMLWWACLPLGNRRIQHFLAEQQKIMLAAVVEAWQASLEYHPALVSQIPPLWYLISLSLCGTGMSCLGIGAAGPDSASFFVKIEAFLLSLSSIIMSRLVGKFGLHGIVIAASPQLTSTWPFPGWRTCSIDKGPSILMEV